MMKQLGECHGRRVGRLLEDREFERAFCEECPAQRRCHGVCECASDDGIVGADCLRRERWRAIRGVLEGAFRELGAILPGYFGGAGCEGECEGAAL